MAYLPFDSADIMTFSSASVSSINSSISDHTASITSISADVASLKTWRADKVSSPDVSTSYSVPTAVITLGLNCPTAAGINSIISTIMTEINSLKASLRTREIFS